MNYRSYRGFFAQKTLQEIDQNSHIESIACGNYIEELDYFEKDRLNKIKQFSALNVEDDIFVLSHRDELD